MAAALILVAVLGLSYSSADTVKPDTAADFDVGSVEGTVFAAGIEGNEPLEGAHVTLILGRRGALHARTDENGSYEFPRVRPGTYRVTAGKLGYFPQSARVTVEANQTTVQDFVLEPIAFGSVSGVVSGGDPAGPIPLEGAVVHLERHCRHPGPGPGPGPGPYGRVAETNEFGEYSFPHVLPGEYRLTVLARGYLPASEIIVVEPNGMVEQNFTLRPAPPPGRFVGQVLGGRLQLPLEGAMVVVLHDGRPVAQTRTNRAGEFEFPELPPGEHVAVAHARGFEPERVEIEIFSGRTTEHTFILRPRE